MLDGGSSPVQFQTNAPEEFDATVFAKKDKDAEGKVREIGDVDILAADKLLSDAGVNGLFVLGFLTALGNEENLRDVLRTHVIELASQLNQGE